MCGIAGIIRKDGNAVPFLVNALDILKNRGYHGFGAKIQGYDVVKTGHEGFDDLKEKIHQQKIVGTVGIVHNRWATHGTRTAHNAHPHECGSITIVHNGTITNYQELREEFRGKLHLFDRTDFVSETDTEVFATILAFYRNVQGLLFYDAMLKSLEHLDPSSTYAFLAMDATNPGEIIAARKGGPLLWAIREGVTYIASETSAFYGFDIGKGYQELHEGDVAHFKAGELIERKTLPGYPKKQLISYQLNQQDHEHLEKISKHWMYDEMKSAKDTILRALGTRVSLEHGVKLGGLEKWEKVARLQRIKKYYIAGCGTSFYSAQIIAKAIQEIAGIQAEAIIASEYVYQATPFSARETALLVISQSGETADVTRLMETWKSRGMIMLGIVNVPNTSIPKMTDAGIYAHIGREEAVASTKAFLGLTMCGYLFAIWLAQRKGMSITKRNEYIEELLRLPQKAHEVFDEEMRVQALVREFSHHRNFLFMGRHYHAITAMEGALKLKEITWRDGEGVHAFGCPAGEMKHGTLAMISEKFPTFAIAPNDAVFKATLSNIEEVQAAHGEVIIVTTSDAILPQKLRGNLIIVPKTIDIFSPIINVIPTQLFAYYMALELGCAPDRPTNLAKSVTVE